MGRARGRPKGGYLPDSERKPALQRIKERHRLLAKYVAGGLTRYEVAARMDMCPERVGQLMLDPAMQNLIAGFRDHQHVREMAGLNELDLLRNISIHNATRAAMAMRDSLDYYEDADERMPVRESAKIFEIAADRVGFGKHSTNLNVNVDFAAQLDQAIDRSRSARTISAKALPMPSTQPHRLPALVEGVTTVAPSTELVGGTRGQESRGEVPAPSTRRVPDRPSSLDDRSSSPANDDCERSEVPVARASLRRF